MFDDAILDCLDRCVLCWLATASPGGVPNVSHKELFLPGGVDKLIIANVARRNQRQIFKRSNMYASQSSTSSFRKGTKCMAVLD